jgi:SNF2 family DNA or RNA helicase
MGSEVGKIMAKSQALNQLCCHPDLIRISAEKYISGEGGSQYSYKLVEQGLLENLPNSSKLTNHVEHLKEALEFDEKNKVIVFSFYPEMARIIAKEVPEYGHVFFNGEMTAKEKAEARARFETDPECRIFFSSDAGGFGVNLFMANYLFNYDLPESAGKSDQRNARHVRASSLFDNVYIVNEVIEGSIEERNLIRLAFKRKVANAITDNNGADISGRVENDVSSLTKWLEENSA